jgi:hypothetical protein
VREAHEDFYALLSDVPPFEEELLVGRHCWPKRPVVVMAEDLGKLRGILPDETDARHLFQAISNGVEYFVTHDKATILNIQRRSTELEAGRHLSRLARGRFGWLARGTKTPTNPRS